jgi:hypothetical protein
MHWNKWLNWLRTMLVALLESSAERIGAPGADRRSAAEKRRDGMAFADHLLVLLPCTPDGVSACFWRDCSWTLLFRAYLAYEGRPRNPRDVIARVDLQALSEEFDGLVHPTILKALHWRLLAACDRQEALFSS